MSTNPGSGATTTCTGVSAGRMRADIGQQIVDHLAQPVAVAHDGRVADLLHGNRAGGIDHFEVGHGFGDDLADIDRGHFQPALLIHPGQQEQIVHQASHTARFGFDPSHGHVDRFGGR